MNCEFCGGKTFKKKVRKVHWLAEQLYIVDDVNAEVCEECGERYYHALTLDAIDRMLRAGRQVINSKFQVLVVVMPARSLRSQESPLGNIWAAPHAVKPPAIFCHPCPVSAIVSLHQLHRPPQRTLQHTTGPDSLLPFGAAILYSLPSFIRRCPGFPRGGFHARSSRSLAALPADQRQPAVDACPPFGTGRWYASQSSQPAQAPSPVAPTAPRPEQPAPPIPYGERRGVAGTACWRHRRGAPRAYTARSATTQRRAFPTTPIRPLTSVVNCEYPCPPDGCNVIPGQLLLKLAPGAPTVRTEGRLRTTDAALNAMLDDGGCGNRRRLPHRQSAVCEMVITVDRDVMPKPTYASGAGHAGRYRRRHDSRLDDFAHSRADCLGGAGRFAQTGGRECGRGKRRVRNGWLAGAGGADFQ